MGIAYHNLYLFLRAHDIKQPEFVKQAKRSYAKARSNATELHKAECDVLTAALLASEGEKEKAEKLFQKIDQTALRGDFESEEYLATYFAATGDADAALDALDRTYKADPKKTVTWMLIGDDFHDLKDDPRYQALFAKWKVDQRKQDLTLSVPKGKTNPKLSMTPEAPSPAEGTYQFAPQMMIKHASRDKHSSKKSSSKTTLTSSKGSKSTKLASTSTSKKKTDTNKGKKEKSTSTKSTSATKKPRH